MANMTTISGTTAAAAAAAAAVAAEATATTTKRSWVRRFGCTLFVIVSIGAVIIFSAVQSRLLFRLTLGASDFAKQSGFDDYSSLMPLDWSDGHHQRKQHQQQQQQRRTGSRNTTMTTNSESSDVGDKDTNDEGVLMDEEKTNEEENNDAVPMKISTSETALDNHYNLSLTSNHLRHAYVFVIGGCDPLKPRHRGYIYNILVSAHLLRRFGSKAHVVFCVILAQSTLATALSDVEVRWLTRLGVRIVYLPRIPKNAKEDFFEMQLRKFDILNLTDYTRVIHMDGDVMPIGNLDYLFDLSEAGILKENVVVAGTIEPANGGFFMLTPGPGRMEEVHRIIQHRKHLQETAPPENLLTVRGKFDIVRGWGHVIQAPDKWETRTGSGRNWTFHAAFADQGLLYHYVKYARKSASVITSRGTVDNFGALPNGTIVKEARLHHILKNFSHPLIQDPRSCHMFMCDFVHFTGGRKPWNRKPDLNPSGGDHALHLWWSTLKEINKIHDLGLNFTNWENPGRPLLGSFNKRIS